VHRFPTRRPAFGVAVLPERELRWDARRGRYGVNLSVADGGVDTPGPGSTVVSANERRRTMNNMTLDPDVTSRNWGAVLLASITLGVLLLVTPVATLFALALWLGAYGILFGVVLIGLGLRLRSWDRAHTTTVGGQTRLAHSAGSVANG
jgi:hypothetical protein